MFLCLVFISLVTCTVVVGDNGFELMRRNVKNIEISVIAKRATQFSINRMLKQIKHSDRSIIIGVDLIRSMFNKDIESIRFNAFGCKIKRDNLHDAFTDRLYAGPVPQVLPKKKRKLNTPEYLIDQIRFRIITSGTENIGEKVSEINRYFRGKKIRSSRQLSEASYTGDKDEIRYYYVLSVKYPEDKRVFTYTGEDRETVQLAMIDRSHCIIEYIE
jgi:hypothetical protein